MRHILRILLIIANIAVCGLTCLSSFGGLVNPQVSVIPALLTLTLPVWLIAVPMLLAVDLLCVRKLALIPALTMVICCGEAWEYCPLRLSTADRRAEVEADSTARAFTVLSYNTWGLADYRRRHERDTLTHRQKKPLLESGQLSCHPLSYIFGFHPEVALLQETPVRSINYGCNLNRQQLDSLDTLYPYHLRDFGESIMSELPMRQVMLREPAENGAWFTAAEINIHGTDILFVSLHLQSIGLNDEDKRLYRNLMHVNSEKEISAVRHQLVHKLANAFRLRARQADLLCEQLDSLDHPNVIIGGDFNDVSDCYAIRQLKKRGFRTVFSSCGSGPAPTYHANRFLFHIDHILYRGDMTPVAYRRGNAKLSDHYPILATFTLPEP